MAAAVVPEVYRFINQPDYDVNPNDVLKNKYSNTDLAERFVAFDDANRRYLVFDDFKTAHRYISSEPERNRCFHEVVFGFKPQKIKLDIDASSDKLFAGDVPGMLDCVIKAIQDAFFTMYMEVLRPESLIVCESVPTNEADREKWSFHIIVDGWYSTSYKQSRTFTNRVTQYVGVSNTEYAKFIDITVNKSTQNFRIVGCHKNNKSSVKHRIVVDDAGGRTIAEPNVESDLRCYVTNTNDCQRLPNDEEEPEAAKPEVVLSTEDAQRVLELCQPFMGDFQFRRHVNGLFIFNRVRASYCDVCKTDHHRDNTLIVKAVHNAGTIEVLRGCFHDPTHSWINVGGFMASTFNGAAGADPAKIQNWSGDLLANYIGKARSGIPLLPNRTTFDDLPKNLKNVYSEPQLRPFELSPTLCVHAQMKMGKTKALRSYIDKYFNDAASAKPYVIRFISFRQTFSSNIKEKFGDFTLYSDVKGQLDMDRLIIQVESLYRLYIAPGAEHPDLLVLDECESVFEQFDSGLLKNFAGSFATFQWLLKFSKHVVCMDANISNRTYSILKRMRPGFGVAADATAVATTNVTTGATTGATPASKILYHCNNYRNAINDKYYFTTEKTKWLGVLYSSVENDEKVAVPMNSLNEAKILCKNLQKKYPTKRIKLYSSETSQSEKKEHFGDVNVYWSQYDVLIYTPTVSAGVSFERKHFNKVFGYFSDQSCNVETCMQMIGRIRDVGDKELYICLSAYGGNLPTDVREIKAFLYQKRENLMREFDDSLLNFEYGPNGEIKYHDSDYFHMWLENTSVRNQSKNQFMRKFIHIVDFGGSKIHYLGDAEYTDKTGDAPVVDGVVSPILMEIESMHKETKDEIKFEFDRRIAVAKELTKIEVDEIQNAFVAQQDITEEQKYAYEKFRLRADYKFEGAIDEKFVRTYYPAKVRRIYKNINRLSSCTSVEEALQKIQKEEKNNYQSIMAMDENIQYTDIRRKYVFEQHRLALGLLRMCGWNGISEAKYINLVEIAANLRKNEAKLLDETTYICNEFKINRPKTSKLIVTGDDKKYVDAIIKFINKVLEIMYGVKITCEKEDDMYRLKPNSLFATGADNPRGRPVVQPPVAPTGLVQPAEVIPAEPKTEYVGFEEGEEEVEDTDDLLLDI